MAKTYTALFLFHLCLALPTNSKASTFHFNQLPKGKSVTLPSPAATLVPVNQTITLSSTDMPQTIKLTLMPKSQQKKIEVVIYDSHSDTPQKIKLIAKVPATYSFKNLYSIRLLSRTLSKSPAKSNILIESNKPMTIRR